MAEYIIGIDEVGWGACAGPLVACAVLVPKTWKTVVALADSKKVSEVNLITRSDKLCEEVQYSIAELHAAQVDRLGPHDALEQAHKRALEGILRRLGDIMDVTKVTIITDGLNAASCQAPCTSKAMVGADGIVPAVMAASIIGKAHRDSVMRSLMLPDVYEFAKHKGYPTKRHLELLRQHGVSVHHRRSYAPVKRILGGG